jgi:enoyl-CoA hydratase
MSVLLYEKRDQVAYITLNRPDSLNAYNRELIARLGDAFADYRDDSSLLVAIITGEGRAFSVGADLKDMASADVPAGQWGPLRTPTTEKVWKPIIAAIDGYAVAGGFLMALECDIRIATERSRMGDVTTRIGGWGSLDIYKKMPFGEALYMHLTSELLTAERAYNIGLVHKVVPDRAAMLAEAEVIAGKIKLCSPLAIQAVKQLASMTLTHTGKEVAELSEELKEKVSASEDAKEGPRAFVEKRAPVWKMR